MKLTDREITLLLGYLKARRMYRGCKPALGAEVWQPWMEGTIQKLTDELPTTHNWK